MVRKLDEKSLPVFIITNIFCVCIFKNIKGGDIGDGISAKKIPLFAKPLTMQKFIKLLMIQVEMTRHDTTAHKLTHTCASKLINCDRGLLWRHDPNWHDHLDLCTPPFSHICFD